MNTTCSTHSRNVTLGVIGLVLFAALATCGATEPFGQQFIIPNEAPLFSDAFPCARCHDNLVGLSAEGAEDISFVHHWEASMMRLSFYDPFWQAKVMAETLRLAPLADAIEDKCSRCHAPMANVQASQDGNDVHIFGDGGFLDWQSPYNLLATEGVSCTLCHQVIEPWADWSAGSLSQSYANSGNFQISESRVAFSKYEPMYGLSMERSTDFAPISSPHLSESAFCAVCHDLYTDFFDSNGVKRSTDETRFPEQTPYIEWLNSIYSHPSDKKRMSCQDCHMKTGLMGRISSKPQRTITRDTIYGHTFLTENIMMLDIISSIAEDQHFDIPDLTDAASDAEEYLTTAGTITISGAHLEDNELVVIVKVTNECGHKLPTSIPVRRVFIHFAVYAQRSDNEILTLFSSGDTDEEGGIIGVDDSIQSGGYERHHNEIVSEQQVQVYEGVMGNWEGEVTYTLLRASQFLKDNRILPKGWNDATAPLEIYPKGDALLDPDFIGGEDTITYRIALNTVEPGTTLIVEAELKDQTLSYPMVHDLDEFYDVTESTDSGRHEVDVIGLFLEEYDHHKINFELIDDDRLELLYP